MQQSTYPTTPQAELKPPVKPHRLRQPVSKNRPVRPAGSKRPADVRETGDVQEMMLRTLA